MIKAIIKKIKEYYESEFEGSFEFEFSIYDVIALILFVFFIFKIL